MIKLFLFIFILSALVGQTMFENNVTDISERIETIEKSFDRTDIIENSASVDSFAYPILNILNKGFEFIFYASGEIISWGIGYGYNHPQYNFQTLLWLMVLIFASSLILPTIVIGYLAVVYIKQKWSDRVSR